MRRDWKLTRLETALFIAGATLAATGFVLAAGIRRLVITCPDLYNKASPRNRLPPQQPSAAMLRRSARTISLDLHAHPPRRRFSRERR